VGTGDPAERVGAGQDREAEGQTCRDGVRTGRDRGAATDEHENEGPERAHYLLERLVEKARRSGAEIKIKKDKEKGSNKEILFVFLNTPRTPCCGSR